MNVIKERNLPHVLTVIDDSAFEELDYNTNEINIYELGQGLAELNKNGICLLDIKAGVSKDGITKISDISTAVLSPEIPEIPEDLTLPEGDYVKFKSDSWALGNYIVKHSTGKEIPKKFLKSQNLLNKFSGENEILSKLLVLDPENRAYSWEVFSVSEHEKSGCSIM
jgi:hypothetical protein